MAVNIIGTFYQMENIKPKILLKTHRQPPETLLKRHTYNSKLLQKRRKKEKRKKRSIPPQKKEIRFNKRQPFLNVIKISLHAEDEQKMAPESASIDRL